jgi:hypothetical protein
MCGIVDLDNSLDLDRLAKDLAKDLPKYARPVFIRLMSSVDMTGKNFCGRHGLYTFNWLEELDGPAVSALGERSQKLSNGLIGQS